jgi:hypothetical protein
MKTHTLVVMLIKQAAMIAAAGSAILTACQHAANQLIIHILRDTFGAPSSGV